MYVHGKLSVTKVEGVELLCWKLAFDFFLSLFSRAFFPVQEALIDHIRTLMNSSTNCSGEKKCCA